MGIDHPGVLTGCVFAQETYCPRIYRILLLKNYLYLSIFPLFQLQRIVSMEHLHACGSLEQRPTLFNEYLDLNWDDKKFKHNFTYEVREGSYDRYLYLLTHHFYGSCF